MTASCDVLVAGGGVIGLTTAFFLAREGARVEVLDQGEPGREASWAGAGIIPPGNPERARDPADRLRAVSSAMFGPLSQELHDRTGVENGYRVCGGIEFLDDPADTLPAWAAEGLRVEPLPAAELTRREPAVTGRPAEAFYLPDTAQVRNPRHLRALLAGGAALGVRVRANCPVRGFERFGDRLTIATTDAGTVAAGRFLIATGAWTDPLLEPFGLRPGVRPVRGQIVLLQTSAPLFRPVLLYGKRYLVPRDDGRVLVGSTEEDAGFEKRTTAEAVAGLIGFAESLVPALAAAHVERCWAGLRPGTPDGLPLLGPVPGVANLFVAAGHFRAGIQLSPGTARVMTDLLLGRPPSLPLEAFRPDRPPSEPGPPAFRS